MLFRVLTLTILFPPLLAASAIALAEPPMSSGDKLILITETTLKAEQVQAAVAQGTELAVEKTQDNSDWVTFEQDGKKFSGWISNDQVRLKPTVHVGDWVAVTAKVAALKSENAEEIGSVKRGTELAVEKTGDTSVWVTAEQDGKKLSGWISTDQLRLKPTVRAGDWVAITAREASVKSEKNEVVTTVKRGSQFAVEKEQDGWLWITVEQDGNKISGWLSTESVRLMPTVHVGDWVAITAKQAQVTVTKELTVKEGTEMLVPQQPAPTLAGRFFTWQPSAPHW